MNPIPPPGPRLAALATIGSLVLSLGMGAEAPAQVMLRGERGPLDGVVEAVSPEGVVVRTSGVPAGNPPTRVDTPDGMVAINWAARGRKIVSWDRVRAVEGSHSTEAAIYGTVMDKAWRARARVERGDYPGAEPMLEELFATYREIGGPTGAAIDEGLLRCRLARGAPGAAIWPWLAWTGRLREIGPQRAQVWVGGTINRPSIRDETTDLVGTLPPIFVSDRTTAALAVAPEWSAIPPGDRVTAELASLYHRAALFETGSAEAATVPGISQKGRGEHPGVRLVADIVAARTGDKEQRRGARTALEQRIRAILAASVAADAPAREPPWVEAWCRAAVGRSLLREEDPKDRRRGVSELLHVPARFGDDLPHLAALALAESAVAMGDLGDQASAAILVRELRQRFPGHPVLEWSRLQELPGAPPPGGAESSGLSAAAHPSNAHDALPR